MTPRRKVVGGFPAAVQIWNKYIHFSTIVVLLKSRTFAPVIS